MKLFVQLGRNGDILTLLPLLWHYAQKGERCGLMVAKDYAGLLDGVSYVEPVVFDGKVHELKRAVAQAKTLSKDVMCVQVNGPPDAVLECSYRPAGLDKATTDCFVKEQWKLAGALDLWKEQLPLVFDKRVEKDTDFTKNTILVSTGGVTSPFPYSELLKELLRMRFPAMEDYWAIESLDSIKLDRLYGLLDFYENKHVVCLVASDSAPLHLAWAVPTLPVVALIKDTPSWWHGSPWRANHIDHIRYSDFPFRAVQMLDRIASLASPVHRPPSASPSPKIIHVWSDYDIEDRNKENCRKAAQSWQAIYGNGGNWVPTPIPVGAVGRDSHTALKDPKRVPLVKDVLRLASFRADADDVLCLTRADTIAPASLTLDGTPCYAHRETIPSGSDSGTSWSPACDLFAFTKRWWREHEAEYPDLLLANDWAWNRVLMELVKRHGGREITPGIKRRAVPVVVHESAPPRLQHNMDLSHQWMRKNNITRLFPKVTDQIASILINPRGLRPYAYNPAIVEHGGKTLMLYRFHEFKDRRTSLALAELDAQFQVKSTYKVELPGNSVEDARWFTIQGELWFSYVESNVLQKVPTSIVLHRPFAETAHWKASKAFQLQYGKNDGSTMEKNWVFWSIPKKEMAKERTYCLYRISPEQVVLNVKENLVMSELTSPGPRWKWGQIRGGTPPVRWNGKFLRFFHSVLDNEPPPQHRRYYMGALLMDTLSPFTVEKVSSEPILRGSEDDSLSEQEKATCPHRKEKVVFPLGVVERDGEWLVSVGINDCQCAIVRVTEKELRL